MPATAQEGRSASARAAVLRIKRGSKTLSQIGLARTKVVVGGGKTAQLRLKNAGLADECVLLDLRETPFTLVGLGPDQVFVNGWAVRKTNVRPGDRIEFSGITLELLDPEGAAPETAAPKPNGKGHSNGNGNGNGAAHPSEDDDPYMGRETAARVFERSQLEGRADRLEGRSEAPAAPKPASRVEARKPQIEEFGEPIRIPTPSEPARPVPPPAAPPRPVAPVASRARTKPIGAVDEVSVVNAEIPRTGFSRPPWLEFVGEGPAAEARLYLLRNGVIAGRQGELRVQHASVSKKHARFEVKEGRLFVEDLGSTNGVWVNRERVSGSREIKDGDTLHLGAVEFKIRIPDAAREELSQLGPASERGEISGELPMARPELQAPTEAYRAATAPPQVNSARSAAVPLGPGTAFDGRNGNGHARRIEADPELELELDDPRNGRGLHERGTDREMPASKLDRGTQRDMPAARLDRDAERPANRARVHDGGTQRDMPAAEPRPLQTTQPRAEMEPSLVSREGDGLGIEATPDPSFDQVRVGRSGTRVHVPADAFEVPPPRMRERVGQATGVAEFPAVKPRRSMGRVALYSFGFLLVTALAGGGWLTRGELASRVGELTREMKGRMNRAPAETPLPLAAGRSDSRSPVAGGASEPARAGRARPAGTRVASLEPVHASSGTAGATPLAAGLPETPAPAPTAKADRLSDDDLWGISRPSPTPTLRPGQSILGDEKLDLTSGKGDDKFNVASLEQDPAAKGLKAERTIGVNELKSIFLDQGDAVVRLSRSDNWDMAPSGDDDASDRAVGAKQVDPGRVNALIRAHFGEVKRCLVGGHFSGGKARVVVEFTLNPDGRASSIHVPESDVKGAGFQSCVVGVIKRIGFPRPKSQSVIVQFPFNFFYQ